MTRRKVRLALLVLLAAAAVGLLAQSRTDYHVDLRSVIEIWGELVRDVDHIGLTVTRVSAKREMEIGREIGNEIARHERLIDGDPRLSDLERVAEALLKHIRRKEIEYRFHVVDSSHVNAFAVSGGGIYVTTAMLDFLQSEAELAALLGHEISHVDLMHCIERLQYELAARKIVGAGLAEIVAIGYGLVSLGFSERQELQADATGMILAAKAGYDPKAAIALQQRFAMIQGEAKETGEQPTLMLGELGAALGKALEQYFATHPPAHLRVRHLERTYQRNASDWKSREFRVGRR